MSISASVIIIIYYFLMISYALSLYVNYKLCPELMWCVMQFLMFFGVTTYVENQTDVELLFYYLLGLICFIVFSVLGRKMFGCKRHMTVISSETNYQKRKPMLGFVIIVSIALCTWFFVKAGGNVFLGGLKAMISDDPSYSVKYARMGMLSVSGVGYIYQLRVMILPMAVLYYAMMNRKKALSYVLIAVMLVFLVGTGQRGGLVSVIAIYLIAVYYTATYRMSVEEKHKKHSPLFTYGLIIIVAGALFALTTVMNGRVATGGTVFSAVFKRILDDNQSCAVIGFRYIKGEPIQYGRDWFMQLLDILPGKNQYTSLATRIFAYMNGGSTAGTAPACIWGVSYYNFGVFGVLLSGSLIGLASAKIHSCFTKMKSDELSVITYSALSFLLAYWVADGPVVLFNNGFIAAALLYGVLKISTRVRIHWR